MFGQQKQQQTPGSLFGATPQLGQNTGGFTFGTGTATGAGGSAPSAGGFNFPAPGQQSASTGFSFGASSATAATIPGTAGGLTFGTTPGTTGKITLGATPATQASGFSFGSTPSGGFQFSKPAATVASTPQTGGFALGSGTSAGLSFGAAATSSTQPASTGISLGTTGGSGFAFGIPAPSAAPATGGITLGGITTAAGPSSFTGGLTLGKPTAATGPTSSGFNLGGVTTQPTGLLGSTMGTPKTQAGGLILGSAPSQGFTLGGSKTTAPTSVASTPAFTFGGGPTAAASASTGFSLGGSSTGLTLGATPTTTSGGLTLGAGGIKLGGAAAPVSSAAPGLSLGFATPKSTSAVPVLGSLSGLAKTTAAPTASTATTSATAASSLATGLSLPVTGGIKFGTTQSTSLSTATTTVAAGLGTIASTASAPSSSAAAAPTASSNVPQLTYRQLEDLINKWNDELKDYEKTFLDQAAQVNAWDRLLMENGEKITELNASVENVKAEQKRLDQELDFIMAQQQELEEMLKPLEETVNTSSLGGRQLQQADKERDFTYKLAKDIDGQLKQMVQDLKSIIDHLNSANTQQQDTDDPITQIAKILNAHMNSLQWIDQNSGILQRKVDEIARLSETRRKEQERNFRLAFD